MRLSERISNIFAKLEGFWNLRWVWGFSKQTPIKLEGFRSERYVSGLFLSVIDIQLELFCNRNI